MERHVELSVEGLVTLQNIFRDLTNGLRDKLGTVIFIVDSQGRSTMIDTDRLIPPSRNYSEITLGAIGTLFQDSPIVESEDRFPNLEPPTFRQKMKAYRGRLIPPLSQRGLAKKAGLGVDFVRKVEAQRAAKVSTGYLTALAKGLELNDDEARDFVGSYNPIKKPT